METYFKMAASMLICLLVAACDTGAGSENPGGQQPGVDIKPVAVSEQIAAFFDTHLPPVAGDRSEVFFVDEQSKSDEEMAFQKTLMINSARELRSAMYTSVEPPDIDFGQYTLIIGYRVGGPGFVIKNRTLDVGAKSVTLHLTWERPVGFYTANMCIMYYWGLFPKLPEVNIMTDIKVNELI